MSNPANIFENSLETALLQVLRQNILTPPTGTVFERGEDAEVQTLPRVIVSTSDLVEAIYQSGNYQATLDVIVKDDLDRGSPEQSATLFASVVDVLQFITLKDLLNATMLVNIQGIVLGSQKVNDVGDRMWSKTVTMDFFGYAL